VKNLTHERLLEVLNYDPEKGVFYWRKDGSIAGSRHDSRGYRSICIDQEKHLEHRLVIFYTTGTTPTGVVDHINCKKNDNRQANLRCCTVSENAQNRTTTNARSGFLGVWQKGKKFKSEITLNGKKKCLGTFETAEDAHRAYLAAKAIYHPTAPRVEVNT
jgi:hypothetical protein